MVQTLKLPGNRLRQAGIVTTEYMLDTNAINAALDQNIEPARITDRGAVFVTHIQVNELQATKRPERQLALLKALRAIDPAKVSTSAAVWNVSEWGGAQWGDADGRYQPLLSALIARNGGKQNNAQDALIGVTAITRGMTLVTNDADLAASVQELGGRGAIIREVYRVCPRNRLNDCAGRAAPNSHSQTTRPLFSTLLKSFSGFARFHEFFTESAGPGLSL